MFFQSKDDVKHAKSILPIITKFKFDSDQNSVDIKDMRFDAQAMLEVEVE